MSSTTTLIQRVAPILVATVVGVILVGFDRYPAAPRLRKPLLTFACAISLLFAAGAVKLLADNIREPPEWDFMAFWIPARAAAERRNFYDPSQLRAVATPDRYSSEFVEEIVDVGFWYPAPTMLFLEPFGHMPVKTASAVWAAVNIAALVAAIMVLWRSFLYAEGFPGLVLTLTLVVSLRGMLGTVGLAQTTFILLLLLALVRKHGGSWRSGVYLTLAGVTKPLGGFFLLLPVVRKEWRVLSAAAIAILIITVATGWRYGWDVVADYGKVTPRIPIRVYMEPNIQSLLATILRLRGVGSIVGSPLSDPVYVAGAIFLVGFSAWVVTRLPPTGRDVGLALLVPCGLLIYPMTGSNYSVLLILPILQLWRDRRHVPGGSLVTIVLLALSYAVLWVDRGHLATWAFLLLWLAVSATALARKKTLEAS